MEASVTPSRNQHTLAVSCEVHGRGYWTGKQVQVAIHPASIGTGLRFIRTDMAEPNHCQASIEFREDASLRTNLLNGEVRLQMVEHLMAALAALEIDNCIIEIDGEEFPALDGSSLRYVEAMSDAGLIIQAAEKRRLVIQETMRIERGSSWVELSPALHGESYFEYRLSFDDQIPINSQTFGLNLTPDRFIREVAAARTFVTEQQAASIRAQGVAAHVTNQDLLVIGDDGPIENTYRFNDECARHKTLDLIGDLALSGVEFIGRATSFRGGHSLNGEVAEYLKELAVAGINQIAPSINVPKSVPHLRKAM
jgi:UDP-3-O-acyl N-acetylglucosamine deacetylase